MILTYGSYTITGTAQELKEFIDLIEGNNCKSNLSNTLNMDLCGIDRHVLERKINLESYLEKNGKQDLYTGIKCEKCKDDYFIITKGINNNYAMCENCGYIFTIPDYYIPKKIGTVQRSKGATIITPPDEAD